MNGMMSLHGAFHRLLCQLVGWLVAVSAVMSRNGVVVYYCSGWLVAVSAIMLYHCGVDHLLFRLVGCCECSDVVSWCC